MSPAVLRVVAVAFSMVACRPTSSSTESAAAPAPHMFASAAAAPSAVPAAAAPAGCHLEPAVGVVIPTAPKSQDFRLAVAGDHALVTWLEAANQQGGGRRARGRLFDMAKGALDGVELGLEESEYGDVILSGIVPLGGTELVTVGCVNNAPTGILTCSRQSPGASHVPTSVLTFVNGGPQSPGVAALAVGADTLTFVPVLAAGQVAAVSSRLPPTRRRYFGSGKGSDATSANALSAAFTDDNATEAMVVYRSGGSIRARRVGWDETWRGPLLTLSEKGTLVGAPAVARVGAAVTVTFASRKSVTDPWMLTRAWVRGDTVTRSVLDVGEATGPTFGADDGDCVRFGWVEGHGRESVTKLGSLCGSAATPQHGITVSQAGVEAGRAYLAKGNGGEVVAWQELPKGKPMQLRIAKLICQ